MKVGELRKEGCKGKRRMREANSHKRKERKEKKGEGRKGDKNK